MCIRDRNHLFRGVRLFFGRLDVPRRLEPPGRIALGPLPVHAEGEKVPEDFKLLPPGERGDLPGRADLIEVFNGCLLYTSDAADALLCVDSGGARLL